MQPVSFKRHRFPADVIRHAVWLYFRFTLSFRDVEEMLAQRGIEASYETIRCWTLKFGQAFARNLRRPRPKSTARWHLDEMVVKIGGKQMWLWRAVDDEGSTCWSRGAVTDRKSTRLNSSHLGISYAV